MTRDHVMSVRLSDAQYAELKALGRSPSEELRRRAFPPTGASWPAWVSPWFAYMVDGRVFVLDGDEVSAHVREQA